MSSHNYAVEAKPETAKLSSSYPIVLDVLFTSSCLLFLLFFAGEVGVGLFFFFSFLKSLPIISICCCCCCEFHN